MESRTYDITHTDTYGGDPNYSWVTKAEIVAPGDASELTIVRRAKAAIGLTGVRCRRGDIGGDLTLHPVNSCTVVFISLRC
jgi:hypothetical protein